MPTVTANAAAALRRSGGDAADHRDELEDLAKAVSQDPPGECAAADGASKPGKRRRRPRDAVAFCQRTQHDREYAGRDRRRRPRGWGRRPRRHRRRCSHRSADALSPVSDRSPRRPVRGAAPRTRWARPLGGRAKTSRSRRESASPSSGTVKSMGTKRGGAPGNPTNNRRWCASACRSACGKGVWVSSSGPPV